ncbi:MAG TPA: serine/threonine-protein kinase [Thermoanaerobaculia bacterium]|jgi:serine/threonine-protein kinase
MTCLTKEERLQVRGGESKTLCARSGSTGERDFFGERLALYARSTFLAAAGFWLAGWVIAFLWPARAGQAPSLSKPEILFHLAAVAVVFLMWLAARQPELSERSLRRIDAGGTFGSLALFALMGWSMTPAWRPELLVLLILNAVLLTRAAIVPSTPRRTAAISALSALPVLPLTFALYADGAPPETPTGSSVAYAFLWASLAVVLSTLVSFVTFRLRTTVARARRLGQYTLREKIGEGGMGVVYRADHEMLRRPTAIKLLPPERAGEESLKRFEREVQLTARLTSPHTVSVYDFGRTPEGVFYYVMEYLDGVDLGHLVAETGPLPPGRAVHILRQVCEALAEAHGIGLIHRDIKPANILLCERGGLPDVAKVVDFGIVRDVTASDARLTGADHVIGTPEYLAPETIRDATSADPRSDLYALGAVAYYLLTGKPVFAGKGPLETIHHHLQTEPEPPSARLGWALPARLEALVLACLAKDPNQRPESARALLEALDACDDVPAWDETQARRWWREHAARKSAAAAREGAAKTA